jgi:hypothetical protein
MTISTGHPKIDQILQGGFVEDSTILIMYDSPPPVLSFMFKYLIPSLHSQQYRILFSIYSNTPYRRIKRIIEILKHKYQIEIPKLNEIDILKLGGNTDKLFGNNMIYIPEGRTGEESLFEYISKLDGYMKEVKGKLAIFAFGWHYFVNYYGEEGFKALLKALDFVRSEYNGNFIVHFYPTGVIDKTKQNILQKLFDVTLYFRKMADNGFKMEVKQSLDPLIDLRGHMLTLNRNFELELW